MTSRTFACVLALTCIAAGHARAQSSWTVDPTPVLDIRGVTATGAVAFGNVNWATRLSSGVIVVADAGGPALQYFDERGAFQKTIGRSGGGPGDFRTVSWVSRCASDTVFAWDFAQSRISTFDGSGALIRTFPFGSRGATQLTSSCNAGGKFVLFGRGRMHPPTSPPDPAATYVIMRFSAPLMIVGEDGRDTTTFGEMPAGEMLGGRIGGQGSGGMPRPLGQASLFALSADRLFMGTSNSEAVDVYSLSGQRLRTIRLGVTTRAPSRAQYERAADNFISIMPAGMRDAAREWVMGIPMPDRLPAYTALLTDDAGLLWVVLSVPGDPTTRLRVLRENGASVADLTVPVNLTVFEVGADYLLGGREDETGEPHLMLFRVRRGS